MSMHDTLYTRHLINHDFADLAACKDLFSGTKQAFECRLCMCLYACLPVCALLFGCLFPISLWSPERSSLWFWPLASSGYIKLCTLLWVWYEPHVDSNTHTGIREVKLKCVDNKIRALVLIKWPSAQLETVFSHVVSLENVEDAFLLWTGPGRQLKRAFLNAWWLSLDRMWSASDHASMFHHFAFLFC